jgi:hypothetical protein
MERCHAVTNDGTVRREKAQIVFLQDARRQRIRRALLVGKQTDSSDYVVDKQWPEITQCATKWYSGKRRRQGVSSRRSNGFNLFIEEPVDLVDS